VENTGLWVLRLKEWDDWLNRRCRFLWIHGIPGAGKTVLASFLHRSVPNAQKPSRLTGSVYYYCYFGNNQDETIPFLGWTVGQLCRQANHSPESILSACSTGRKPTIQQLLTGLEEILCFFDVAYVVLDAVDESSEPRSAFLDMISKLVVDPRFEKIQLLATSREYGDIESVLATISVAVSMKTGQVDDDIRTVVNSRLQSDKSFSNWPSALQHEVGEALATGAKGM
jgi:NACHT domain